MVGHSALWDHCDILDVTATGSLVERAGKHY
jgi:hypothetical protein